MGLTIDPGLDGHGLSLTSGFEFEKQRICVSVPKPYIFIICCVYFLIIILYMIVYMFGCMLANTVNGS